VLVAQSKLAEAAVAIQGTSDIAAAPAAVATVAALYKAAGNEAAAVSTLQSALKVLLCAQLHILMPCKQSISAYCHGCSAHRSCYLYFVHV
jgi:hypothetical protein